MSRLDKLVQLLASTGAHLFSRRRRGHGLYLWGPVGTGKSFLVELFFAALPDPEKTRMHYQHFMAMVHREMNALTGTPNPLQHVARTLSSRYRVICLDELYLTDIGDAMIITRLFEALFAENVMMLVTSNFPPEKLYRDDLQPEIFAPAIILLRQQLDIVHLDSNVDYRQLHRHEHQTWFVGDEQDFGQLFMALNNKINSGEDFDQDPLLLHHRSLPVKGVHGQLAWFDYSELCDQPRSPRDYIALAQRFKHVMLSGVPRFGQHDIAPAPTGGTEDSGFGGTRAVYSRSENSQRRFMSLVDELYDQGIKLYIQASVPLAELYAGGRLAFEFQRTVSRLSEMQSASYRDRHYRA